MKSIHRPKNGCLSSQGLNQISLVENKKSIYSTAALSLIFTTILLSVLLWMNQHTFGRIISLSEFPRLIQLSIFIIGLDALCTIPFARLREQGRPRKFAFVKIFGIVVNVFLTWFFIAYCPDQIKKYDDTWVTIIYDKNTSPVVYVLLANVTQSAVTLILLGSELAEIGLQFNFKLCSFHIGI